MNKKSFRLALIGKDVSQSQSPQIHTFILGEFGFGCEYEKISATPSDFDVAMRRVLGDFDGFSITIPYKRDVLEYLDAIDGDALACNAVNTVVSQTRMGYNTDGKGFCLMLETAGVPIRNKRILVLGAGGAGRSVAVALKNAGASVLLYRRNAAELQEACQRLGVEAASNPNDGGYDVLINCTGVGMHDTIGVSPVASSAFCGAEWAVDLIYAPSQSEFLSVASKQGVKTLNGAAMLFYQAYYADCLFMGRTPQAEEAKILYEKYQRKEDEGVKRL